ncbi:hypothetical protein NDU88_001802 [Pleurodeles waltl]|uniref:Uncharacterized protein n=1 Tax=Pleurodeles waltl TaxID=8319 RepID=A0AAV7UWE3_PLEWA|nr:hypothetical protein NDU88_001802 [Pleurodeles waltl]
MRPGKFLVPGHAIYYRRLHVLPALSREHGPGRFTGGDGSINKLGLFTRYTLQYRDLDGSIDTWFFT